jgi:(E)-4-hydroxy-3-methylbut-2-enyl-diphosphate synthase
MFQSFAKLQLQEKNMIRKKTYKIFVGDVAVGGDAPVSIQSMTNTKTYEIEKTIAQIIELENAGCEIVRLAIPDEKSAAAISAIKKAIQIPLIADIHFDYKLALLSMQNGIDGLRINPGNIGSLEKVEKIVNMAKERKIPIRIGVNSGSLSKKALEKYGVSAQALVESALEHVQIVEKLHYEQIKISVKASSVPMMLEAYRLLSEKVGYPLHLGVTEAGTIFHGTIHSAIGIGTLLAEGIGDTIRVSLTAPPVEEIKVAKAILQALDLRKGLKIISCPTCGRTNIDLLKLTEQVEQKLAVFSEKDMTVAVMGCIVNGPGEAREADYGIAGGEKEGLLFKKGSIIRKVPENQLLESLLHMIEQDTQ